MSGRLPDGTGLGAPEGAEPDTRLGASPAIPSADVAQVIAYIAKVSENVAWQAGVGGMETAGSIVSFLAAHPEHIDEFMAGGSLLDWPFGWHEQGCLTWHAQNGKVVSPAQARRARIIRKMEKGGQS